MMWDFVLHSPHPQAEQGQGTLQEIALSKYLKILQT